MKLIDKSAILYRYQNICNGIACLGCPFYKDGCALEKLILDSAVVDAEPVVHCEDCKYSQMKGGTWGDCHNPRFGDGWGNYPPPSVSEDGYCAWGEKLEKEENETD